MAHWLIKSEPDVYSWEKFVEDKRTAWEGVANPTALKHLREMKRGDLCLFYHTGEERRIVGIAEVVKEAYPDPKVADEKRVVVDLKFTMTLKEPVSLQAIKAEKVFAEWDLLKIGRLSVVPTTPRMFERVLELSSGL